MTKVLIYGAGKRGRKILDIYESDNDLSKKIEIVGFIDANHSNYSDGLLEKYKVYSPEIITSENIYFESIIVSPTGEMREQIKLNIPEKFYDGNLQMWIDLLLLREDIRDSFVTKYSPDDVVGDFTYGYPEVIRFDEENSKLRIGRYCSIASGVKILLGGEHIKTNITTYPFSLFLDKKIKDHYSKGDVVICNDVWIASDVKIISGVTIGDGAVIGANSVVSKNVEPYAIYCGNPAKLVGYRFEQTKIDKIMEMKWWDWNLEDVASNIGLLLGSDIDKLYDVFKEHSCNSEITSIE